MISYKITGNKKEQQYPQKRPSEKLWKMSFDFSRERK